MPNNIPRKTNRRIGHIFSREQAAYQINAGNSGIVFWQVFSETVAANRSVRAALG